MPHCDDETLSLLALGEDGAAAAPGAEAATAHLAGCPQCRAELESLRAVVVAAREVAAHPAVGPSAGSSGPGGSPGAPGPHLNGTGTGPASRTVPPERVWQAISATTGVRTAPRDAEVHRHAELHHRAVEADLDLAWASEPAATAPSIPPAPASPYAPSRPPSSRRPGGRRPATARRPMLRLVAIAATFLLVGLAAGIGSTWAVLGHRNHTRRTVVLAETDLSGLALAPTAAGTADVVETRGGRQLDLNVQRLAAPNGFYEVWLIDRSVTKMVAVGVLSGSAGRFSLPAGVDLASYPLVDISIQPLDGDPKHSGRSVLRGTLRS